MCIDDIPAQRGEELEAEAIGDAQSVAWDEAENRRHVHKGRVKYLRPGSDDCVRARLRHGLAATGLAPPLTRQYIEHPKSDLPSRQRTMTMLSTVTSKGQVTIPQALRQRLGLVPEQAVEFALNADATCITLRPTPAVRQLSQQGFGMVKASGPHVPADWGDASWLKP